MSRGGWDAEADKAGAGHDGSKAVSIFSKQPRERVARARAVGSHHENDFGTYFLHRQLKTDQQMNK